jgi:hypothetical protein
MHKNPADSVSAGLYLGMLRSQRRQELVITAYRPVVMGGPSRPV